jgi:2-dehydro-3-deoxyphosphogluconate aldolase/(4S)-4-hydroxy-2-oxoglutarate aldolase
MQINCNELMARGRLIPVVNIAESRWASPLAEALTEGGLAVAEITLRSDCALAAIESLAARAGFLVGAGTVLNRDQAAAAIDVGAAFIVSPGLDEATVEYCLHNEVPVYPGVGTATELQRAFNMGLRVVKFFPAEALGGTRTLAALSAPFREMKFLPTGGIGPGNLGAYLQLTNVLACGGSWMVKPSLYEDGGFSKVVTAVREAVGLVSEIDQAFK